MLFPIGAHLRGLILTVQFHTGNKYITFGAEREWAVPLLQDHRCVPHVAANKMDPEGAPYFGPLQSLSHWACDVSFCLREGYTIRPGFIQGVGGEAFLYPPSPPHSGYANRSPWIPSVRSTFHSGNQTYCWSLYQ